MDTVLSETLMQGSRTYFFDVKRSTTGKFLLLLTESRWEDGRYTKQRIAIPHRHCAEFMETFGKLLSTMNAYLEGTEPVPDAKVFADSDGITETEQNDQVKESPSTYATNATSSSSLDGDGAQTVGDRKTRRRRSTNVVQAHVGG